MKNELLFIWVTFLVGSLDSVEQWFRVVSYGIGIIVGIFAIINYIRSWRKGQ